MKKIMVLTIIIIVSIFSFFFYKNNIKEEKLIDLLENAKGEFEIDNYYIFGTHFNFNACMDEKIEDMELVLKNNEEEIILTSDFYYNDDKTCFSISDKLNDGIYLDDLKIGNYLLLVKINEEYYSFINKTEYKDLEYYTITKNSKNNKIKIIFDNSDDKNYVEFKIKESKLPDNVYDIAIDPGHGGKDSGAIGTLDGNNYYEANLTLNVATKVKEELENYGLKVKLTRDSDVYLSNYDKGGRAVIPNQFNTKYSLSLHLNSSTGNQKYGGVEVYIPNDVELDFAELLSSNIAKEVDYSKKITNKVSDGIYFTYFDENDIESAKKDMKEKKLTPYDIKLGAPYMYMIREVGGVCTYAYVDGRNDYYGLNPYYNSNKVSEPYLIEMAYMNYDSNLRKVVKEPKLVSNAIVESIVEYLNLS